LHHWGAIGQEIKVNLVEGTLTEFKKAAGNPYEISPELGIMAHNFAEEFGCGLMSIAQGINLCGLSSTKPIMDKETDIFSSGLQKYAP
jgi:hypothetical protein